MVVEIVLDKLGSRGGDGLILRFQFYGEISLRNNVIFFGSSVGLRSIFVTTAVGKSE